MLSIIVCSKHTDISPVLMDNISKTAGIRHEIICIDNSENKYSIFSAYNEGIRRSKFPFLCFVHEDVFFVTKNWGQKVIKYLSNPDTGIVGIAGSDMVTRVPADWAITGNHQHIIQTDKKNGTLEVRVPPAFKGTSKEVYLLDGVFLCMRKELTDKIKFDELLGGFHGYDFDISLQSVQAGYTNLVAYNILLEHYSQGRKNIRYYQNLLKIFSKWEHLLPLLNRDLLEDELRQIDLNKLKLLCKRLIKRGSSVAEVMLIYLAYNKKIGLKVSKSNIYFYLWNLIFMKSIFWWGKYYYR